MVSWFNVLSHRFAFSLVGKTEDERGEIEKVVLEAISEYNLCLDAEEFWDWMEEQGDPCGVILMVEKEEGKGSARGQSGEGEKQMSGGKDGGHVTPFVLFQGWNEEEKKGTDQHLVGYKNGDTFEGIHRVSIQELLTSWAIQKKVKGVTATRSGTGGKDDSLDRFVPTVDGMIDGRHVLSGLFTPGVGDKCQRPEELANRPSSIFIPFAFWARIQKMSEGSQEAFEMGAIGEIPLKGHISAAVLAQYLIESLKETRREETGKGESLAKRLKVAGQKVLDFLWAAHNHLVTPVETSPAGKDIKSLLWHSECLNMLTKAHKMEGYSTTEGRADWRDSTPNRGPGQQEGPGTGDESFKTPDHRPSDPSGGRLRRAHLQDFSGKKKTESGAKEGDDKEMSKGWTYNREDNEEEPREGQRGINDDPKSVPREGGLFQGRTSGAGSRDASPNPRSPKKGQRDQTKVGDTNQQPSELPPLPERDSRAPAGRPPVFATTTQGRYQGQTGTVSFQEEMTDMKTAIIAIAENQRTFMAVAKEIHETNKSSRERDIRKDYHKKPISRWVGQGAEVLKILSAKDGWDTASSPEFHKLTPQAEQLFDLLPGQAIDLVRQAARFGNWPGGILRVGLSQFVKRGLINRRPRARPEAFSVLFFHPADEEEEDDPDFELQQTRETFNEKREISEHVVKAVSKSKIFLPERVHQAIDMIRSAIGFLKYVCGPDTIAVSGYQEGIDLIDKDREAFERASRASPQFLLHFLCLLDREFQNFLNEVVLVTNSPTPIQALVARGKQTSMEDAIYSLLSPWLNHSVAFSFQAPEELEAMIRPNASLKGGLREIGSKSASDPTSTTNASGGKGRSSLSTRSSSRSGGGSSNDSPGWWHQLSEGERIDDWRVPAGRRFGDFFNSSKSDNTQGMPKVPHHRTGRNTYICLKHQLDTCGRGAYCNFAHVLAKTLPLDTKKAMTDKIRSVYAKGGDS